MALSEKKLELVYSFDAEIGEITKKMFRLHVLKEPDDNKIIDLLEVVRSAAIHDITDEDIFQLEKFISNLTHYACNYVHGVAIFANGRKNLYDMSDNVKLSNELPQNYIGNATSNLFLGQGKSQLRVHYSKSRCSKKIL